jgi:hypothetical protein
MISFSRFRHQLIYSSFNLVIIVDDRRAQLFNVAAFDDSRVIVIERRCSRRQSSNSNWTSLIETFVESRLSLLSFWLRAHAFILRYVLYQTVKNILQRRRFQAIYSIVNLLISTNKEIFIDDHLFFFLILLKSLRITRFEFCDVSTSISNTVQTYRDDSTRIMLDQLENSFQYRLMNVT